MEGEIGRFRRNHLTPVISVESLDELNVFIAARGEDEDTIRRIAGKRLADGRVPTVDEHFALERPHLAPLPAEPFEVAIELICRVDHKARICVKAILGGVEVAPRSLISHRGTTKH